MHLSCAPFRMSNVQCYGHHIYTVTFRGHSTVERHGMLGTYVSTVYRSKDAVAAGLHEAFFGHGRSRIEVDLTIISKGIMLCHNCYHKLRLYTILSNI